MIIHNSLTEVEGKIIQYFKKYKLEIQLNTQLIHCYKISFFVTEDLGLTKKELKEMILDCISYRSDYKITEINEEEIELEIQSTDVLVIDGPQPEPQKKSSSDQKTHKKKHISKKGNKR